MRKGFLLLSAVLLVGLSACGAPAEEEPFSAAFTIRPEPSATEVFFDTSYAGETQVVRSDALDESALRTLFVQALFGTGGETAARWTTTVQYALTGAAKAEDEKNVADLAANLAHISGFPVVRETSPDSANLHIRFDDTQTPQFRPQIDDSGRIQSVQITIPASYDVLQRRAALNEALMRACGFLYTAQTPLDSVLSKEKPAASLTDADWTLLEVLYGYLEPGDAKDVALSAFARAMAE